MNEAFIWLSGHRIIVLLTEKFLMARNVYRIFTENNPVMGDSKTFCIPEAKGLSALDTYMYLGKYINILTDFDPCSTCSRRVKTAMSDEKHFFSLKLLSKL